MRCVSCTVVTQRGSQQAGLKTTSARLQPIHPIHLILREAPLKKRRLYLGNLANPKKSQNPENPQNSQKSYLFFLADDQV